VTPQPSESKPFFRAVLRPRSSRTIPPRGKQTGPLDARWFISHDPTVLRLGRSLIHGDAFRRRVGSRVRGEVAENPSTPSKVLPFYSTRGTLHLNREQPG